MIVIEERFWAYVNKDGPIPINRPELGPCWLWTGGHVPAGYGAFSVGNKSEMAHRVAYQICVAPIPDELETDHLCRNRGCVRPSHLEPVTPKVNQHRGEGFAGVNFRKTECVRGHPLSGDNLYISPDGERQCRTCRRDQRRAWEKAKREAGYKRVRVNGAKGPWVDNAKTAGWQCPKCRSLLDNGKCLNCEADAEIK